MEPACTVRSSTVQEFREGVAGAMGGMAKSAALPPVAASIFSASVGGAGPAATQEAGWTNAPAAGLAKLTFLTSMSVACGFPGMALSSFRTIPYLASLHTLAVGGFSAAAAVACAVMASGSPPAPEKLAPLHGPPGCNSSWVQLFPAGIS